MKLKREDTINGDLRDVDYNLGHFFMDYMTKFPEDCVWQIDAGTAETESNSSVKSRSIRLAKVLRNAGLRPGDVAVVSGRNHLDVHIPFYAAYMNGLSLAGIDPIYKYGEVMPMEVEAVIQMHPGVAEACVVGVSHVDDGSCAVAVVQRRAGAAVGEQDIKDLVASKLYVRKHLHGGVIFVEFRPKVRDMVLRE